MNKDGKYAELLPTEADIAFYREHGYWVSKKIFSDEEIENACIGMEDIYAGNFNRKPAAPFDTWPFRWQFEAGLRKSDFASFYHPHLAVLRNKRILAHIGALLNGTTEIRLWHDQLLYKPSQKGNPESNVGWHTDRMYWKTCTSPNMVTAWIPFHDVDDQIGTITMIDGSNHWPDNTTELDFFSSDMDGLEAKFRTGGHETKKVPLFMERGQVSFHHCLTIHGSGPNLTDRPRRALAVHLQDQTNTYQKYYYESGDLATHNIDTITNGPDGLPDYRDPAVCPVLFEAD